MAMTLPILISHPTGNANSKQAALAFAEAGLLRECHTTLAGNLDDKWASLLPKSWQALLVKRSFPALVRPFIRLHPWRELIRQLWDKLGIVWFPRLGDMRTVAEEFDRTVARSISRGPRPAMVYAYMDAAEQTFFAAKLRGSLTIYELPTPYWRYTRDVVEEEARRQPAWAMTLPTLAKNDPGMQRRDRELQMADVILVPSELVRESLQLAPPFRGVVRVVPYGCPEPGTLPQVFNVQSPVEAPLRVLYVGSLNQGKGISYLATALEGLEQRLTLTLIGSRTSRGSCPALDGLLLKHRHLSGLTNAAVLEEMQRHDVLILPTLYEGLALVLLEAMACGLTVITTESSGLAGMITNGKEGCLVPVRDALALRRHLQCLASDRVRLASMRASAQAWSRDNSWSRYRQMLRNVISDFVEVDSVSQTSARSLQE